MNAQWATMLTCLIAAALFFAAHAKPLIASATVPAPEDVSVSLFEAQGHIISYPPRPTYDFGIRSADDDTPIVHSFVLQNKTDHALTIDLLRPSCGCITAAIDRASSPPLPFVLMPGKRVPVRVTLQFETAASGPIEKDVSVFLHGQPQAATVLALSGTIQGSHP